MQGLGLHSPSQVSRTSVVITTALQQMAAMHLWRGGGGRVSSCFAQRHLCPNIDAVWLVAKRTGPPLQGLRWESGMAGFPF